MSTASPAPGNGPVSGLSAAPADALSSITQSGFTITTRKLPILKAGPIEEMTQNLKIAPPEMIFGDNLVRIENAERGWWVEFNAYDALDKVDKTGESMLKVSYSSEWQRNRFVGHTQNSQRHCASPSVVPTLVTDGIIPERFSAAD